MNKKYKCQLIDVIVNGPIVEKCYDNTEDLTYDDVLIHMYEDIIQKYLFKPFSVEVNTCIENDVRDILRRVINNNISEYIKIEACYESCIHGKLNVKYIDINTKKEVKLYELYKYTPDNLLLIDNGLKPINKAM